MAYQINGMDVEEYIKFRHNQDAIKAYLYMFLCFLIGLLIGWSTNGSK